MHKYSHLMTFVMVVYGHCFICLYLNLKCYKRIKRVKIILISNQFLCFLNILLLLLQVVSMYDTHLASLFCNNYLQQILISIEI